MTIVVKMCWNGAGGASLLNLAVLAFEVVLSTLAVYHLGRIRESWGLGDGLHGISRPPWRL